MYFFTIINRIYLEIINYNNIKLIVIRIQNIVKRIKIIYNKKYFYNLIIIIKIIKLIIIIKANKIVILITNY